MTTMINTKPIYNLLEKVTLGKGLPKTVNGVKIKLPAKYIRYFPSDYESENFSFVKSICKPGDTILDIGAHIGIFATITSKIIGSKGKIFAFEPTPNTFSVLNQTVRINSLKNVIQPVNQAMGIDTGLATFFISDSEADNGNSLISYKVDRKLNGVKVFVNTIDNFVAVAKFKKIDFIKIDVEGAEYDTLRGGIEVFKKHRPYFILAIHPEPIAKKGDKLEDIYDLLLQLNYKICCNNKPISKEAFCAARDLIDLQLSPM